MENSSAAEIGFKRPLNLHKIYFLLYFYLVPLGQGFNLMYDTWVVKHVKWSGTLRKEEKFPKNERFLLFYEFYSPGSRF